MRKNNKFLFGGIFIIATVIIFAFGSGVMAKSAKTSVTMGMNNQNNTSTVGQLKNQFGQLNAEEHRSAVANFVQTLLKTPSSTDGGIGAQVRVIAREQNQNHTTTAEIIDKLQLRNKIKTFLIGSDYKNLGTLRSEMVKTRNRLEKLKRLTERTTSTIDFQDQIQTLEQEQNKIESFIKAQEGKFSLFGWLVKLFNK
ncbi:MAG TPA: hypothetical protein PKZ16_02585 [bacterium]|nr:hypothetical protein [bacterium]HPL95754.1 hypothetical protein [bacterium]